MKWGRVGGAVAIVVIAWVGFVGSRPAPKDVMPAFVELDEATQARAVAAATGSAAVRDLTEHGRCGA